jgi:hypothetical protein
MAHPYNIHDLGDLVRVASFEYDDDGVAIATTGFQDLAGTLLDPTVVKLSFKTPAGVTTTYIYGTDAQLVKVSTGKYYVDLNANAAGTWYYRWWATGTGQAAEERQFVVRDAETV